jgi:segregation and condensation protein B
MIEDNLEEDHESKDMERPEEAIEEEAATATPVEFEEDAPRPAEEDVEDEFASEDALPAEEDEESEEAPPDDEQDEPTDDEEPEDEEPAEVVGEDFIVTSESVVEAVLFASDEALTPARLAKIVETGVRQVREHVKSLNKQYRESGRAFRIEKIAGGYQMLTLSPYNNWLRKLLRVRDDSKLSAAAIETLAIIAYKQPIIRADIEAIRGVSAGEMIRSLMYKGLVKIVGRAEVLGRPMLYGTTKKFLEVFGLNTLKDLPKIEELKKPQGQ